MSKINFSFQELCNMIDITSDTMDNYMYVCDLKNDFYYIGENALERFCLPSKLFSNVVETHKEFVYPEDYGKISKELEELMNSDRESHNMQYRWLTKTGEPVWINCRGSIYEGKQGERFMIGCINEIGAANKADNVSGLLKLRSEDDAAKIIEEASKTGFYIRIGVDDLRGINARLGIEYGDKVIKYTARCIQKSLGENQMVYRIDGDEFLVIDNNKSSEDDAATLFRNIRANVERLMLNQGYEVVFMISGGILMAYDAEGSSYSEIMQFSEFALTLAKKKDHNSFEFFDKEKFWKMKRDRSLLIAIREAIANNFEGFETYYQPQVSDGKVIGAEALMRFKHPIYGMVSPTEFIPVLEESGLIIPTGRWIIYEAFRACMNIRRYQPDFKISINLSVKQIQGIDMISELMRAFEKYPIPPECLVIELTESVLLETDYRFGNLWKAMKNEGVMLALDDFGTGYSNFHYISELKPNILKIDYSMTKRAAEGHTEKKLVKNLKKMADDMKIYFCLEGIESESEMQLVNDIKPRFCQGYYYGKPCPYGEFVDKYIVKQTEN